MGGSSVQIGRSAEKEVARLPLLVRRFLVQRVLGLRDDPRPHGSQELSGEDKYRLRQSDYRIVYMIDDTQRMVTVVRVAHRSDVYR